MSTTEVSPQDLSNDSAIRADIMKSANTESDVIMSDGPHALRGRFQYEGCSMDLLIVTNIKHATPRLQRLTRGLVALGWKIVIVSPKTSVHFEAPGVEVRYVGEHQAYVSKTSRNIPKFIKNMYWKVHLLSVYPDPEKNWKEPALEAATEVIQSRNIDIILSSSSPISSHKVCAELSRKYHIPWVAEYRDLWTGNHNYLYGPILKLFDKRDEKATMQCAKEFVVVSKPMAYKLEKLLDRTAISIIPTGYEETPGKVSMHEFFTITYSGQYYPGKQRPERLLSVIDNLIKEGRMDANNVRVNLYGTNPIDFQRPWITVFDRIPNSEMLKVQKASQVLWYPNWEDPTALGILPLKFMEYLGARRPILLTGEPTNDMSEILNVTKSGYFAPKEFDIRSRLLEMYSQFLTKGTVDYAGVESEVARYKMENSVAAYSELLTSTVRKDAYRLGASHCSRSVPI